jgi:hypothetical protein
MLRQFGSHIVSTVLIDPGWYPTPTLPFPISQLPARPLLRPRFPTPASLFLSLRMLLATRGIEFVAGRQARLVLLGEDLLDEFSPAVHAGLIEEGLEVIAQGGGGDVQLL